MTLTTSNQSKYAIPNQNASVKDILNDAPLRNPNFMGSEQSKKAVFVGKLIKLTLKEYVKPYTTPLTLHKFLKDLTSAKKTT